MKLERILKKLFTKADSTFFDSGFIYTDINYPTKEVEKINPQAFAKVEAIWRLNSQMSNHFVLVDDMSNIGDMLEKDFLSVGRCKPWI